MASLSDSLWHRNRVLAEAALEHTFVQGIASGELARARFAYYLGQDAAFLDAFCRAYADALVSRHTAARQRPAFTRSWRACGRIGAAR